MAKRNFDRQLAELETLNTSPEAEAALRKALANRNNYLVSKAAAVAARLGLKALAPDMLEAIDRFYQDPAKTDPQCWAKNALVQALADLDHDDAAVFLRGLRHVQMEPVFGGHEDSAGVLRSKCAAALVQCPGLRDLDVLRHLLELLVDPERTVRVNAAQAIGRVGRPEAALLLRLKALSGDAEPEALGACFAALLPIEGGAGIDFVARFLERDAEAAGEAAFALGLTHERRALEILREGWKSRRPGSPPAHVWFTSMALTRLPEAVDFLLDLVEKGERAAVEAIEALASARVADETRARLAAVVERSGDERLRQAFRKGFGAAPL